MVSDARTDFSMIGSLLFLIVPGGGARPVDAKLMSEDQNKP
jgi:hypothetical protein